MARGSKQAGPSRAAQQSGEPTRQTHLHDVPPTTFQPASQAAADQQRLLEMEETIRMLVRRNQDMERQFRVEIENLRQQQSVHSLQNRQTINPVPPMQPAEPVQQDDQGSSSSIPNEREVAPPPVTPAKPRPDLLPNPAPTRGGVGDAQRSRHHTGGLQAPLVPPQASQVARSQNDVQLAPAAAARADSSHRPAASQRSLAVQDVEAMIARRLAELKQNEKTAAKPPPNKNPFTEAVQAEVLPVGTHLPKFESYDGTKDPVDHIVQFENTMLLHNFADAIYCKAFATTLKSTARTWFHQLPGSSISTFAQLSEKFTTHFMASRPPEKDASYLMTLK